jgi:hypothetical protein
VHDYAEDAGVHGDEEPVGVLEEGVGKKVWYALVMLKDVASWRHVSPSIILKKSPHAHRVSEEVLSTSDTQCLEWEITYHTGLKFLIAICTADWRCGCGWMNRSGLTFPLACGMLDIAGDALPKTDCTMDEIRTLESRDFYKQCYRIDDGIPRSILS